MDRPAKTAAALGFSEKCNTEKNWHGICYNIGKSDTLISFLLKKVCFVPQSGPFSIIEQVFPSCTITGNI